MKSLSVGIPVFNEEQNIAQLLVSIAEQDSKTFNLQEIIVYDDGSKDGTLRELRNLKAASDYFKRKLTIKLSSQNRGKAHGLNVIFKHFKSDYLVLVDSDLILADKLILSSLLCQFGDGVGLVGGWYEYSGSGFEKRVFKYSSALLLEVGKHNPIYLAWGGLMAIDGNIVRKKQIPERIHRIDLYIYLMIISNAYTFRFEPGVRAIDKKTFGHGVTWYAAVRARSSSIPASFRTIFGQDLLDSQLSLRWNTRLIAVLKTAKADPLGFWAYMYYRCGAFIINLGVQQKETYLWRR